MLETNRLYLRHPVPKDADAFIQEMSASTELHHPWVDPPLEKSHFEFYCKVAQSEETDGYLIIEKKSDAIVGVINLNQIVYGVLCNASVGYYVGSRFANKGYMKEALLSVIDYAFREKGLHRIEANIQPGNRYSKRLVKRLRFRYEGLSPKYIYIKGQWCDHERYALTIEDYIQKILGLKH